ncbi:Fatty acyl-coenzyme A reductase, partial [Theobroma cacao]
ATNLMGALFLNSFSVSPSKLATVSNNCNSWRKKNIFVHCQGSGNAVKTSGVSSVLRERSKMVNADRGATVMDAGSLVMSPNGNSQADIALKDLVPYGGSTTSLVELQEGIGIVKFLRGKDFFITGSTGFLAKVLIEKILRTVPDVGKIFLLIKAKNREAAMERLKTYVNGQRQGRIMEKPFDIGDCIARENLISETTPTSIPELDVEDELLLALNSKKGFDDTEVAQKMKELGLERARKYGWQDAYAFTKAMGEMMINNMRGEIPVLIIRPSVIESTCKEPFPGWMEGNRMMDPLVLCYGKGQLTGFLADPNGVLDVVPADMVVNATLAAIARHGMTPKPDISIYHIASSVVNPLVFQDLARLLYEHYSSSPFLDSKGSPIHVPSVKLFNSMEDFSAHLWRDATQKAGLTAVASWGGKLSHKLETISRKSVEQAKYLANKYEPYTFYGGRFDNSNTERLMEIMSEEEKRNFGFDVESIDWKDYIKKVHIPGLKRHVLKGRGMCT